MSAAIDLAAVEAPELDGGTATIEGLPFLLQFDEYEDTVGSALFNDEMKGESHSVRILDLVPFRGFRILGPHVSWCKAAFERGANAESSGFLGVYFDGGLSYSARSDGSWRVGGGYDEGFIGSALAFCFAA